MVAIAAKTSSNPAKILVVDDNEANRVLAQQTLEDEGYQVLLATGGAEAVALFASEAPDCILLDVRMPDVDGFAVCRQVRALPGGEQIPIVFLTALRDVDTFDSALRAGGDDFLTKPVRPTELLLRVQTALKLRRVRVELGEQYDLLKSQRSGRGLGLTFCRLAAEAHGGAIWVEDANPGAVLCVRLPNG